MAQGVIFSVASRHIPIVTFNPLLIVVMSSMPDTKDSEQELIKGYVSAVDLTHTEVVVGKSKSDNTVSVRNLHSKQLEVAQPVLLRRAGDHYKIADGEGYGSHQIKDFSAVSDFKNN